MTQEGLARALPVTVRTVSAWCNGETEPRWSVLARVAGLLGKDVAWFYTEHSRSEESAA